MNSVYLISKRDDLTTAGVYSLYTTCSSRVLFLDVQTTETGKGVAENGIVYTIRNTVVTKSLRQRLLE